MKKKKIGRNDPCPCGSGKKYKKCCLDKLPVSNFSDYLLSKKPAIKKRISNRSAIERAITIPPFTPKKKPKRKKHHYVPIWYQKRFLPENQSSLFYLNLQPFKELPDGRQVKTREIYEWGPGSCFHEKDLYTTRIFGTRNTDIEEFLFGKIDNDGALAIKALVENDYKKLSNVFIQVFEYMDAQKLRTPKGLDWIRSNYFQLTQIELMLEMQFLRKMHCTMWVQGVMEIVSAKDSDIKFIISDHPVTVYNPACSPDSEKCQYPNDPHTAWKASQTIFPLDLNHCFILTNLEYARDPDGSDPLSSRTNPRYFAETLTRWDTIIRKRDLNPEEVSAINYIVKARAHKFIAAAELEWLYPRKAFAVKDWESLKMVPFPPKDELWHFGGEILVGGKNGGLAWHQDAFGRQHTSRDHKDPVREYSIKRRNQILFDAIMDIFGFAAGKDWDDFRKEIDDEKIKKLYGVIGGLWNPDTEILKLMPKPSDKLSAFYSGTIDPRVVPLTVIGYSMYVDKIIMISPFPNPRVMRHEYSPYESPSQYKYDTIKNVALFVTQIMPLIDADIVEMIPDPCDFDPSFRMRIYKMAEARTAGRGPSKKDLEQSEKFMRDDFKRFLFSLPPESIKHQIKNAISDLSEEDLEKAVEYIKKEQEADPFAPLQQLSSGKDTAQLQVFRVGGNLEMALYLAQATGSFIYTDVHHRWLEIQSSVLKKPGDEEIDPWAPLSQALNDVSFNMYLDPDPRLWYEVKTEKFFKEFISLFRRVCTSVRNIQDPDSASAEAKELAYLIQNVDINSVFSKADKQLQNLIKENNRHAMQYKVKVPAIHIIPTKGLSSNSVSQILLTHGSNIPHWDSVPFGTFLDLQNMEPIHEKH
jgi:hypothetical protein